MSSNMGLGPLGGPNIIFKRKFRWRFSLSFTCGSNTEYFWASNVFSGSRPKINIDEVDVHYNGQKYKIPAQEVTYEPIEFSFYDVVGLDLNSLYRWIQIYMRTKDPFSVNVPPCQSAFGRIILEMLDGCGNVVETCVLWDAWPSSVDFGELDMSQPDACMIKMTVTYNAASINSNLCDNDDCGVCQDAFVDDFGNFISIATDHCPLYVGDTVVISANIVFANPQYSGLIELSATSRTDSDQVICISSDDRLVERYPDLVEEIYINISLPLTASAVGEPVILRCICNGEILECEILPLPPEIGLCCAPYVPSDILPVCSLPAQCS